MERSKGKKEGRDGIWDVKVEEKVRRQGKIEENNM